MPDALSPATTAAPDPASSLAAFSVDDRGVVVSWTVGAEQILGWSARDVIGREPPVPPPWPQAPSWAPRSVHDDLLDEPRIWPTASGSRLELAISLTRSVDAAGRSTGMMVVARDISVRDRSRAQLEAYARDVRESYGRELQRLAQLEGSYLATVQALATAVEAKDGYTGEHIRRVHALGLLLAAALIPEEVDDPQLSYGFLLHDVGKLSVPDAVLVKPGKLDDEEWQLIRRHPEAGARILRSVPFLDRALDVVLHHHERWDGGGYPSRQRGEQIPTWARIFAVVDTVDAMTSDRPYRAALPLETATRAVLDNAGAQFDPRCAEAFASLDREEILNLLEPHGER